MGFMNSFLEDHGPAMQRFLDQVAVVDVDAAPSGYQGSGDLALQLAVLHAQLCTIFAELDQVGPEPTTLNAGWGDKKAGRLWPQTASQHPFCIPHQATCDSLEPLPTILRAIEEGRPVPVSVPMRLPLSVAQVHSR